jgi:hypothetical protein
MLGSAPNDALSARSSTMTFRCFVVSPCYCLAPKVLHWAGSPVFMPRRNHSIR